MIKSHAALNRRKGLFIGLVVAASAILWLPSDAQGITPDNPRVKSAVRKALEYLDSTTDARLGARALVGLTYAKHGESESHPKIAEAIKAIQGALQNGPEGFQAPIYDTSISIMFLVAVDPSKYRYEIESIVRSLHLRQKTHGAWGYPESHPDHGQSCDTSMTQYAVLGLWEAEDQADVETPRLVWDRVARWLLLTQDPGGGFGYQGKPATRLGNFEAQEGVRDSMTIAGMGSLYVVKDRIGITQLKKASSDDTPDALVPYESPEDREARIKTRINLRHFARALANGNRWIESNCDVEDMTGYVHYALYALERYESLREAEAAGRRELVQKTDDWKWYNRGARFLLRTQKEDGSWESQSGVVPDTCFGALFLMGSTRKSLERASAARYASSTLIGGQGIPLAAKTRVRDGQVVVHPLEAPLDQVLAIARQTEHPEFNRAVESLADAARSGSPEQLAPHSKQLIALARYGDRSTRLLAIRCIARAKELDVVPVMIQLLSDGDPGVAYAAAETLSGLSRKYDTLGFSRRPSPEEREASIEKWKAWFRSIRPDADLNVLSQSSDLK